ncbi:MAG: tail fiber domain-containing protein [Chitinophagaceae bacterium]
MSIVRKQPTRLVLLGWVVLTILVTLTQTAFTYQDQAKKSSETLKDNKPTQTAFTYQGQLKAGSVPANGTYAFRFALYTGQSVGHELGVVIKDDVVVTNGSFTVQLDFGRDGFSSNEGWLEVGMRPANSANPYTTLSPRQRLTLTRNAIPAQAESWSLIGVLLGFSRGIDTDLLTVDKIADQSVTGERIASGQVVKSINFAKDILVPAVENNATVKPSGSTPTPALQDSGSWTLAGRTLRLSTRIDNVGIGTEKPIAKLDVAGTIHASEAVTVGNSVGMLSSASLNLIEVDNASPLAIGFSNPMSVTPNAATFENIKVGIGTTNPAHNLTVFRAATPGPVIGISSSTAQGMIAIATCGGCYSTIANPDDFVLGNASLNVRDLVLTSRSDNPNGGAIRFATGTISGADTEKMRLTQAGDLGIGTPSPTQKLDVNGQARIRVLTPGPLLNDVVVAAPNGVLFTRPASSIAGGGSSWLLSGNALTTGNEILGTTNNFPLKVFTNNSERMRILTNGNVGIGTTTPNEQLEITGNFRLPFSTASVGVIKSGANRFIHNCCNASNFATGNFFGGMNAGNLTLTGTDNVGVGVVALGSLTSGSDNTAVGSRALVANTTGAANTAVGRDALRSTNGVGNTAVGTSAMIFTAGGSNNTAMGMNALSSNVAGGANTAVGSFALNGSTGSNNTALGNVAGSALSNGSNNIYINNVGAGTESGTIRIGTPGQHTRAFIAGIRNVPTGLANAIPVVIDTNGQLGTVNSSRRFKEHIENMGTASEVLYRLRPVRFLYKAEFGGRPDLPQFGLIAEDVAKVSPELVAYDDQGKPYTVYYQFLVPMLLNEVQKKDTEIEKLRARLDALEKLVEGLTKK